MGGTATRCGTSGAGSGSSDLYETTGRRPYASINFVTAHDGFTLADLVAYNEKHNEANGEDNRDGESHNRSWNHGAEGPTDDPEILAARRRHQRNLLATLFLSQGVPMLLSGDEIGRTQHGNNNAYCQDNELSWLDWEGADDELLDFTRRLIAFRHEHPAFHRRRWFLGRSVRPSRTTDIEWFRPDGSVMAETDWSDGLIGGLGVFVSGEGLVDPHGEPLRDDSFFLAFNMGFAALEFCIPNSTHGRRWQVVLDTAADVPFPETGATVEAGMGMNVPEQSVVVLKRAAAVPAGQ
jgi:glycogen operon protein